MTSAALLRELARTAPFDALDGSRREALAAAATITRHAAGEVVLDAFRTPSVDVFLVLSGRVEVWSDADRTLEPADEELGPGGLFGFSAMLSERSVGPRVVALTDTEIAALPAADVGPAFSSTAGARFLAREGAPGRTIAASRSAYALVDDLIVRRPLRVGPELSVAEVARLMTEQHHPYAVVEFGPQAYGLVTDAVLRRRVLVDGVDGAAPVRVVADRDVTTVALGDSAAEAQILLLESDADVLLVIDRGGDLRGVLAPRDFAVSPGAVGVSLHEQLRRAASTDELRRRARRVAPMLSDLLSRGLASERVIAVYSAVIDTVIRRSIQLIFAGHPELSVDAFTWLALGSNGRREAVLSSDVDSAVAFDDQVGEVEQERYRRVFGEVDAVLAGAGFSSDGHGATARRAEFSRTNQQWRNAAEKWLAAPERDRGAVMTSLLVDGRAIHGDPGLPAASRVFTALRAHPGTMRLLLRESLSHRATLHSLRDLLTLRTGTFDVKTQALLPIVSLARWAALAVDSTASSTTARLRDAAGSEMVPHEQAANLIEVFGVLQRLRLRQQLLAYQRGAAPSDEVTLDRLSPIDRGMVSDAVRVIGAAQRRMGNVAAYTSPAEWTAPAST